MALKYENLFPLNSAWQDPNLRGNIPLCMEYHEQSFTVGTNESTAEVTTDLSEVLGILPLNYLGITSDPTDSLVMHTDGIITTGAVTVNTKSADVADGAITLRFFLVGRLYPTTVA